MDSRTEITWPLSIDTALDKIQYHFMLKVLSKLDIEKKTPYLNIIKLLYDKPTATHYSKWGQLKVSPLKSETR